MANWKDIHPDFTSELQERWEERGFDYEQTKEWIQVGLVSPSKYILIDYLKKSGFTPQQYIDFTNKNAQEWIDHFYSKEKRTEVTDLDIEKQGLEGSLNLNDFISLKNLWCGTNKITSLDLGNCEELNSLDCDINNLTRDNLILSRKARNLTFLNLRNNQLEGDLTFFSSLINLQELWIANNKFFGSLFPLQKLTKLKELDIEYTNITGGLEYLPESLEGIYCDGCEELKKELKIYSGKDENNYGNGVTYNRYEISKWKSDVKSKVSMSIPVERLYDTQKNMRNFFDKWDKKIDSLVKGPKDLNKYWMLTFIPQWTNRATSVAGGVALIYGYNQEGGWAAVVCPFIEIVTSQLKDKYYDDNKREWESFVDDSESLWDNYQDLFEVIEPIRSLPFLGKLDKELNLLKDEIKKFLNEYDTDGDGRIDTFEREEARKQFSQQLRSSWIERKRSLQKTEDIVKRLQKEVVKQRQGLIDNEKEVEQLDLNENKYETLIEISSESSPFLNEEVSADTEEITQREQIALIEVVK